MGNDYNDCVLTYGKLTLASWFNGRKLKDWWCPRKPSKYNCYRRGSCMIHRFVERLLPFVFVFCFPDVQPLFPMQMSKGKKLSQKTYRWRILWIWRSHLTEVLMPRRWKSFHPPMVLSLLAYWEMKRAATRSLIDLPTAETYYIPTMLQRAIFIFLTRLTVITTMSPIPVIWKVQLAVVILP